MHPLQFVGTVFFSLDWPDGILYSNKRSHTELDKRKNEERNIVYFSPLCFHVHLHRHPYELHALHIKICLWCQHHLASFTLECRWVCSFITLSLLIGKDELNGPRLSFALGLNHCCVLQDPFPPRDYNMFTLACGFKKKEKKRLMLHKGGNNWKLFWSHWSMLRRITYPTWPGRKKKENTNNRLLQKSDVLWWQKKQTNKKKTRSETETRDDCPRIWRKEHLAAFLSLGFYSFFNDLSLWRNSAQSIRDNTKRSLKWIGKWMLSWFGSHHWARVLLKPPLIEISREGAPLGYVCLRVIFRWLI